MRHPITVRSAPILVVPQQDENHECGGVGTSLPTELSTPSPQAQGQLRSGRRDPGQPTTGATAPARRRVSVAGPRGEAPLHRPLVGGERGLRGDRASGHLRKRQRRRVEGLRPRTAPPDGSRAVPATRVVAQRQAAEQLLLFGAHGAGPPGSTGRGRPGEVSNAASTSSRGRGPPRAGGHEQAMPTGRPRRRSSCRSPSCSVRLPSSTAAQMSCWCTRPSTRATTVARRTSAPVGLRLQVARSATTEAGLDVDRPPTRSRAAASRKRLHDRTAPGSHGPRRPPACVHQHTSPAGGDITPPG